MIHPNVAPALFLCAIALSTSPLQADQTAISAAGTAQAPLGGMIEDTGGSARIDLSGKLRMLSQRLPSALCAVEAGISPSAADVLHAAAAEGDAILDALQYGNNTRGVYGAETDPKLIRGIERVAELWTPIRDHAVEVERIGATPVDVATVQDRSHELLARAMALTSAMSNEYANPVELLQADAITIDIAGRQRMLTQRTAKDACLIASGLTMGDPAADLTRTMETYETALAALRTGLPEAGVTAPPSAAIYEGLEAIAAGWTDLRPALDLLRYGGQIDPETRTTLFEGLNALTADMNTVVGLYSEASKLGL